MKNLSISPIILMFLISYDVCCQVTPEKLIKMSKEYYLALDKFSIEVRSRFKNMIVIDTLTHSTQCYIDKSDGLMIFKAESNAFVKTGSNEYSVSYTSGSFSQVKNKNKRYSAYESEFKHFPFTETEIFFDNLSKSLNYQSKISESDSNYLLLISGKIIAFRRFDFSLQSITEINYDRIFKGFQYSQNIFDFVNILDSSGKENIKHTLSILNNPANKEDDKKREMMPEFIERDVLEKNLTGLVNGRIESIKNKSVFLDFFYQGCYPCVKSYPYVNSLFNAAETGLVVIGVDQLPSDTLTIDRYIKKYNLQYPILVGQAAAFLTSYFKLHSFPTFIVIDTYGRVIKYGNGFTKSSFKMLTKKILR